MRVSDYYHLGRNQGTLDFVNVDTSTDVTVFIDPRAIRIQGGDWNAECEAFLVTFFSEVLDSIRLGDSGRVRALLGRLGEPNETHLGLSKGRSRGRGLGGVGSDKVADALSSSVAARSGLLRDLEDSSLLVPRIGPDIISDMTTHVIRGPLIGYTQRACDYYGIPMELQHSGPVWHPDSLEWTEDMVYLPRTEEGKLLLVPKSIVRHRLTFDKDKYFSGYLAPVLESEEIQAGTELVRLLKNGSAKVNRDDLKNKYGTSKIAIVEQTIRFEQAPLNEYRKKSGTATSPSMDNESLLALMNGPEISYLDLYEEVAAIAPGNGGATPYHRATEKLLTAVFYPALGNMRIEDEIHEGRKRIDIAYDNIATLGFFSWVNSNYFAPTVPVECKNYVGEIGNEELDQIGGRLSRDRGWLGFITCRSFEDKRRFISRCRDTAKDGRGYIIALDDGDLRCLAQEAEELKNERLQKRLWHAFLREKFQSLIS